MISEQVASISSWPNQKITVSVQMGSGNLTSFGMEAMENEILYIYGIYIYVEYIYMYIHKPPIYISPNLRREERKPGAW